MNWNQKNRTISKTFVMLGIFCITITMLGINVIWTGVVFFILALITHWFAKLTK